MFIEYMPNGDIVSSHFCEGVDQIISDNLILEVPDAALPDRPFLDIATKTIHSRPEVVDIGHYRQRRDARLAASDNVMHTLLLPDSYPMWSKSVKDGKIASLMSYRQQLRDVVFTSNPKLPEVPIDISGLLIGF